ncbi:MAG: NADH dehydrogenase [Acidobacteria bacterium RIFCSPLOWO2_02_FULL_59_13]|nr:MAG: NADH dehydrogenase [Acidobacteria bacterium RIFCSPLOWO2_02_FULL_59_13]
MSLLLNCIVWLPAAAAVLLLLLPRERSAAIRPLALLVTLATLALSLVLPWQFDSAQARMQFVTDIPWISSPPIRYHIGVDGISLFLILLITFLSVLCVLASWRSVENHVKEFFFFLLLLESGTIGVFVSMDLFLFYVFWEVSLVPMYFLIGIWGHERRIYAAVKFFLFTLFGSVLMLVGIIWLYNLFGTFDYEVILRQIAEGTHSLSSTQQIWLFLAFFAAFAIKVPLFPLHTWLPDAHVEAPTAGSVMLAGVLLKMGTYGLLRFCLPLFPDASHALAAPVMALAVIGIIYGSLVAMVQPDLKKLIAYSSVAHLGFVVLGIFSFNQVAVQGSVYQMLNHGVSTGALFLLVGMIYDRRHTRLIRNLGGLATPAPALATLFLITTLSSIGLPLLNNFVGEFLILLGVFQENMRYTVLAATGVVLSAAYMLWMYQRVFLGEAAPANQNFPDLDAREKTILFPAVALMLIMGVFSPYFLGRMDASAASLLDYAGRREIRVRKVIEQQQPEARITGRNPLDHRLNVAGKALVRQVDPQQNRHQELVEEPPLRNKLLQNLIGAPSGHAFRRTDRNLEGRGFSP